jgi:hypothetical protein
VSAGEMGDALDECEVGELLALMMR